MKNEKSFHEKMKEQAMRKLNKDESFVLDIYIQMVIDEALFKDKRSKLEEKINHALDTKNHEAFLSLSKQYNQLMLHF